MNKKLIAIALWLVVFSGPAAFGAVTQTYRFIDTEFAFRYSGGLSGYRFESRLIGTFEVTISEDEPAFISNANIQIGELSSTSNLLGFGSPVGANLTDYLHDDLLGSPVVNNSMSYPYNDNIDLDELSKIPFASLTRVRLEFESPNEAQAQLFVSSTQPFTLDGGSASTLSPGFTVELIPEPSTLILCSATLLTAFFVRSRQNYSRSATINARR